MPSVAILVSSNALTVTTYNKNQNKFMGHNLKTFQGQNTKKLFGSVPGRSPAKVPNVNPKSESSPSDSVLILWGNFH